MNRKSRPFLSAGLSSILLVFVLLCLITFAVLSLTSANVDYRFSEKVAERTKAYYAAEGRANLRLKEIDGVLREQYNSSDGETSFLQALPEAVGALSGAAVRGESDGLHILFEEPIDGEEQLCAELTVEYPRTDGESLYRIVRWQSEQTGEWDPQTSLPVMQ